jgi:PAS domain S-box-containing protein
MWVFETKTLGILAANDAATVQYGYSHDEFLGLTLHDLRLPEDAAELRKSLAPVDAAAHFSGRFRHIKKNRSVILVDVYSGPVIWEGVTARISTAIDVTERSQADERLREQANMLSQARDAIIIRNFADQRVTFWSAGAERLYGWTAEEAVGQPIGELIVTEAGAKDVEADTKIIASSGQFHGEVKQRAKNGDQITVDGRATLITGPDGKPRSVLLINTDITEQKKLELQLLRGQRLESIGTLASGVAHDLNNVLAPILMCAEMLRETDQNRDPVPLISLIEESARRGAAIVKQVLTFARGVEGERVLIKATHLIQEITEIAQRTFLKAIQIVDRYPQDLWSIKGDPTQLHQVLLNLCVNARDAMPHGGTIEIDAENFEVDENYASITPGAEAGPHVMFRVRDTGGGMPRDVIDKIFDPFFTTKEIGKGTGLGLSTVLGIVKSHGGFISVHSELDRGTTFRVFLPADRTAGIADQAEASLEPLDGKGQLILVVDDEPSILRIAQMILESHHYQVLCAKDGPEALAAISQEKETISAVVTDISMPHMDGATLIRAIKKMKPKMKFIASTGQEEAHTTELHELDVSDFLTKPYGKDALLKAVRDALDGVQHDGV